MYVLMMSQSPHFGMQMVDSAEAMVLSRRPVEEGSRGRADVREDIAKLLERREGWRSHYSVWCGFRTVSAGTKDRRSMVCKVYVQ